MIAMRWPRPGCMPVLSPAPQSMFSAACAFSALWAKEKTLNRATEYWKPEASTSALWPTWSWASRAMRSSECARAA